MFNNGEKCPSCNYSREIRYENACDELKKYATGIIDSNDNDGVAKWIENKKA